MRSDEWPSALAYEIWASLEPSDTIAVAEMLKKLMKLKLSRKEDRKKLGKRIAMIQGGYTCKVDGNQKLAVVSMPAERLTLTNHQETMICDTKREKMTAKRLIEAIQQNFRLKGGANSDDKDIVKETALFPGNFPGNCYNCGKSGRKRPDCLGKKKPFSGMGWYNRKFHECNGNGHKLAD